MSYIPTDCEQRSDLRVQVDMLKFPLKKQQQLAFWMKLQRLSGWAEEGRFVGNAVSGAAAGQGWKPWEASLLWN